MRSKWMIAATLLSASLVAHADTFNASGLTYTDPTHGTISFSPATGFSVGGQTVQSFSESFSDGTTVTIYQTITIDGISASLPIMISAPKIGLGPIAMDVSFVIYPTSIEVGKFLFSESGGAWLVASGSTPFSGALSGTITPVPSLTAATPEPASIALFGIGLLGIAVATRRRSV